MFLDYDEQGLAGLAREGYIGATLSPSAPAEAQKIYKKAAQFGVSPLEAQSMTPQEQAERQADKIDFAELARTAETPVLLRSFGNPLFATAVKDDVTNMGRLERAANWIAGDPKSATGDTFQAARNSVARGLFGAGNTNPLFGNVNEADGLIRRRADLLEKKRRFDAGESAESVFAGASPERAAWLKQEFDRDFMRQSVALDDAIRRVSERIAHFSRATALYPEGEEVKAFHDAKPLGESVKEMFFNGNLVSNLVNMGPEMLVQFAPTAVASAVASVATAGAAGAAESASAAAWLIRGVQAAVQGHDSFEMDFQSSLLSRMTDRGVNIYDSNDVYKYLTSPTDYAVDREKAVAHAVPVALLDAAGPMVAPFGLPQRVLPGLKTKMPKAAAAYESFVGGAYTGAFADFFVRSQVQGLMGASGEALGQINADGAITSWSDVVAEYAGEHFTAPVEIFSATKGAHELANFRREQAEAFRQAIEEQRQAIQSSPTAQQAPDVLRSFMQQVGEEKGVPEMSLDIASLSKKDQETLATVLPGLADKIRSSAETGTPLNIGYGDFAADVLTNDAAYTLLADHAHLPEGSSTFDAALAVQAIERKTAQLVTPAARGQSAEFKKSLKVVADALEAAFAVAGIQSIEAGSNIALIMNHVANMAVETGMTPEQVWATTGFTVDNQGPRYARKVKPVPVAEEAKEQEQAEQEAPTPEQDAQAPEQETITPEEGGALVARAPEPSESQGTEDAGSQERSAPEPVKMIDLGTDLYQGERWHLNQSELMPNGQWVSASFRQEGAPGDVHGEFIPGERILRKMATGDRSTLLHEGAHWFLNARISLVKGLRASVQEMTPQQVRFCRLTERAVNWASGKSIEEFSALPIEEQTAGHEKFARTYEQYLKNGVAPVEGLANVFARFSAWLRSIYGVLKAVAGSDFSPEAQELFDELFTVGEATREAQIRRDLMLQALPGRLDEKGNPILDENGNSIPSVTDDLDAAAAQRLLRLRESSASRFSAMRDSAEKHLRRIRNAYLSATKEQVRKDYENSRQYQAWLLFAKGTRIAELIRTSNRFVKGLDYRPVLMVVELKKAKIPPEQIEALKALHIAQYRRANHTRGTLYDNVEIIKALGFQSLEQFCAEMSEFQPKTKADLEAEAQARFEEEHPELATDDDIRATADAAVFTPEASRLVAMELSMLEKNGAQEKATAGRFRLLAKGLLANTTKRMLSKMRFKDNAERAARNANALLTKTREQIGHPVEEDVIRFKRQELLQMELARQSDDFMADLKERMANWKKWFNGKDHMDAIPVDYFEVAQWMLSMLDCIGKPPRSELTLEEFRDKMNALGARPEVPAEVERLILDGWMRRNDEGNRFSIDDATVTQIQALMDFMDDFMSIAREQMKITVDGRRVSLAKAQSELTAALEANRRKTIADFEQTDGDAPTARIKTMLRKCGAAHARIPALLTIMEGTRFGKMFDFVIKRANACTAKENELRAQKAEAMDKAYAPLKEKIYDHTARYYEDLGATLTYSQLVAIALNMGNEGNLQRLIEGAKGYPFVEPGTEWTRETLSKVVGEAFTPEEIQAFQNIWDVVGSLQEESFAVERRSANRLPTVVKPDAVTFGNITLKGGYYPIVYDRQISSRSAQDITGDTALQMLGIAKAKPKTASGFVKERAHGTGEPLALTFRGGFEGLDAVIHDICWREALADFGKLFDGKGPVAQTIRSAWGKEYEEAIRQWIQDIAVGNKGQKSMGDGIADFLRRSVSVTSMGFNLVTAIIQPIGYVQTVALLGGRWAASGLGQYISNPMAAKKFALENSAVMRERARTRFRELAEAQSYLSGSKAKDFHAAMTRAAYLPISIMQMTVDVPTWIGAYNKALDAGLSHEDAVARADFDLTTSQGSGSIADVSAMERGGSWSKLFTVFYTFFNTTLNLSASIWNTESRGAAMVKLFEVLALQPMIETVFRAMMAGASGDDEWDKDLLTKMRDDVAKFNLGLLIGVRELSFVFDDGARYSGPTGTKFFTDVGRLVAQGSKAWENGAVDAKTAVAALTVAGDLFNLPVKPIERVIKAGTNEGSPLSYLTGVGYQPH